MTLTAGRTLDELYDYARAAVLGGVTMRGFDGPDGVTQDEALEIAGEFFAAIESAGGWTQVSAHQVT